MKIKLLMLCLFIPLLGCLDKHEIHVTKVLDKNCSILGCDYYFKAQGYYKYYSRFPVEVGECQSYYYRDHDATLTFPCEE